MKCLRDNSFDNSMCRLQSKDYLQCRMDKWVADPDECSPDADRPNLSLQPKTWCLPTLFCSQLMAKEPLEKLGFADLKETSPSPEDKDAKE